MDSPHAAVVSLSPIQLIHDNHDKLFSAGEAAVKSTKGPLC